MHVTTSGRKSHSSTTASCAQTANIMILSSRQTAIMRSHNNGHEQCCPLVSHLEYTDYQACPSMPFPRGNPGIHIKYMVPWALTSPHSNSIPIGSAIIAGLIPYCRAHCHDHRCADTQTCTHDITAQTGSFTLVKSTLSVTKDHILMLCMQCSLKSVRSFVNV